MVGGPVTIMWVSCRSAKRAFNMTVRCVSPRDRHRTLPTATGPIGATGVSMHVMAALQVRGEAEEMQVPGAWLAGIFNMGGAAVANYVSILEPLR